MIPVEAERLVRAPHDDRDVVEPTDEAHADAARPQAIIDSVTGGRGHAQVVPGARLNTPSVTMARTVLLTTFCDANCFPELSLRRQPMADLELPQVEQFKHHVDGHLVLRPWLALSARQKASSCLLGINRPCSAPTVFAPSVNLVSESTTDLVVLYDHQIMG